MKKAKKTRKASSKPKTARKHPVDIPPVGIRNYQSRTGQLIKLLRSPEAGEIRGHGEIICTVLKKHGGKMIVADLIKALKGRVKTVNKLGISDCYAMVRPVLISKGWWR